MPEIALTIAGRDYRVQCAPGDEPHLRRLAGLINTVAGDAQKLVGNSTESRTWLFTALLLADRLIDAEAGAAGLTAVSGDGATAEKAAEALALRAEALATALEKMATSA